MQDCHLPFANASAFQPFSSLGTFETLLIFWWNLDTKNNANLRILTEPCKELAEPRLKNTDLRSVLNIRLPKGQQFSSTVGVLYCHL